MMISPCVPLPKAGQRPGAGTLPGSAPSASSSSRRSTQINDSNKRTTNTATNKHP